MPATFRATDTFDMPSRGFFLITGKVETGVVKLGMKVKLHVGSASTISVPIDGIEMLDNLRERKHAVALCRRRESAEEIALLKSLRLAGVVLEIED